MPAHHVRPPAGRPSDSDPRWVLLDGCPTPGSPEGTAELSGDLLRRADVAGDTHATWQDLGLDIGGSGWEGRTAEAFLARLAELGPALARTEEAFRSAGRALSGWAEVLRQLKHRAFAVLADAEDAVARLEAAREQLAVLAQAAAQADAPDPGLDAAIASAQAAAGQADADLARARQQAESLRGAHDDGVHAAVRALHVERAHELVAGEDLFVATLRAAGVDVESVLPTDPVAAVQDDRTVVTGGIEQPWVEGGRALTAVLSAVAALDGRPSPSRPSGNLAALVPHPWPAGGGPIVWPGTTTPGDPPPEEVGPSLADVLAGIPTVPEVPVTLGVDLGALAHPSLPVVRIPTPLLYFSWFDAVTHATSGQGGGTPRWPGLEELEVDPIPRPPDTVLGVLPAVGGVTVSAPLDPEAVR